MTSAINRRASILRDFRREDLGNASRVFHGDLDVRFQGDFRTGERWFTFQPFAKPIVVVGAGAQSCFTTENSFGHSSVASVVANHASLKCRVRHLPQTTD